MAMFSRKDRLARKLGHLMKEMCDILGEFDLKNDRDLSKLLENNLDTAGASSIGAMGVLVTESQHTRRKFDVAVTWRLLDQAKMKEAEAELEALEVEEGE